MPRKNKADEIVEAAAVVPDVMAAEKARRDVFDWKRKYKQVLTEAETAQAKVETLLALQDIPDLKKFKRLAKSGDGDVAVIIPASDWHAEEQINSEAVNGCNSFDLAEAERRIKMFYSKPLELIEWQNQFAKVSQIWHPLLGDLMTGYIHPELQETNALSPTQASIFLRDMIREGIDLWLRETKLPIFIPAVVGNHGRTTEKKRIKTGTQNSFEWLLYKTLADNYRNHSRVHWYVASGAQNIQQIKGHTVRFHHGDGLRYNGGIGGISIPINKAVAQWNKVTPADLDVFGHWHQFLWHYPRWVCCPSLIGYTEFSLEIKAEYQRPAQAFIVLDKKQGVTMALPIYVTKEGAR